MNPTFYRRSLLALWFVASLGQQVGAQTAPGSPIPENLLSVAERSNYTQTATFDQTVALVDVIAAAHPEAARRSSMGATEEGRVLPLLILSRPPVSTPQEARELCDKTGRVLVFLFGNIHAGEVDGKEALPMLARELLSTPNEPLLDQLVIVIAPIYNADGNERFAPNDINRKGQNGPTSMGIRENSKGLDLNRDYVKLASAEGRSMVQFFNEWDPHVVADCHITNGSYHRFLITYAGPKAPAGDSRVIDFSNNSFLPDIDRRFEAATGEHAFWYGSYEGAFTDQPRGHTRWETFPAQARYGTTYVGLRGRLSVLVESYSYAPYKERVLGTRDFCRAILQSAAAHAGPIRGLCDGADRYGTELANGGSVAIRSRDAANPETDTILGYTETTTDGRSGLASDHAEYQCLILHRAEAELTVTAPVAYAIPPEYTPAIEIVRNHGIRSFVLEEAREAKVELATIDSLKPATREFQGHVIIQISATTAPGAATIAPGSVIVPLDQPLSPLAVYLLEPACEDGLAAWNFFDSGLALGKPFPVLRITSPIETWKPEPAPSSKP